MCYICRLMRLFWVFIAVLALASCSKFRKIEKNPDWRVKFEASQNYFAKKDYYRASVLLEQIMPIIRGLPEAEKAQFTLPIAITIKNFICWLPSNSNRFTKPTGAAP